MPYIFFRCNKCERKYSSWSDCVQNALCECGGILVWKRVIYGDPPSRSAQPFEPVVLFRDPTAPEGQYRTPGWSDEPTPAGFERVEIRSIREWEGITRQMSAHGRREAEAAYYERQQAIDKVRSEQRAELRREMKHWDGPLREFAAHALERSENKQRRPVPTGEVVAHALEYDSSNREAWRDERTGWNGRRS
jgi:hypothetical protein